MISEFVYGVNVNHVAGIFKSTNDDYPVLIEFVGGSSRYYTGSVDDWIHKVDVRRAELRRELLDYAQVDYSEKRLHFDLKAELPLLRAEVADLQRKRAELIELSPDLADVAIVRKWRRDKRQYFRSDERAALDRIFKMEGWE